MKAILTVCITALAAMIPTNANAASQVNVSQAINISLSNGQSYSGSFDISPYLTGPAGDRYSPSNVQLYVTAYSPAVNIAPNNAYLTINYLDLPATTNNYISAVNSLAASIYAATPPSLENDAAAFRSSLENIFGGLTRELSACTTDACFNVVVNSAFHSLDTLISSTSATQNQIASYTSQLNEKISSFQNQGYGQYAVYTPRTFGGWTLSGFDPVADSLSITSGGYAAVGPDGAMLSYQPDASIDPGVVEYNRVGQFFIDSGRTNSGNGLYGIEPGSTYTITADGYSGNLNGPVMNYSGSVIASGLFDSAAIDPTTGLLNYTITASTNSTIQINRFDLGFDLSPVASVPETSTWMMMVLGFGAIGFAMRRRDKVSTAVRFT